MALALCSHSAPAPALFRPPPPFALGLQDFTPTCCTSGRGHLIFGDARGYLKLINRDLEESRWQAFESGVLHLHQLTKSNILVSIGNEGGLNNTTIKIWRLDKSDAEGNPMLARALKVFSSKFPAVPVTSFSVLEDLSQLALGLGNGAVMLFDGNILRDRNVKQSLIQGQGKTVVAVHFREPDAPPASAGGATSPSASSSGPQKTPPPISLFVVTTASVSTIYTKHPRLARLEIDGDNGCEELAGTCMNDEKRLVLATKDAVFFYESEEKREAYGFEGAKKICTWFNGYLVLVCENNKSIDMGGPAAGAGEGMGGKKSAAPKSVQSTPDTLTIYDLKNKFIAYTLKMESIAMLVSEFSSLFVVTHDRKFFQLSEHDLNSKMERLFKMNLYQISISLASNSSMDRGYVMDIFQRYGDHLYSKGDYDGAIQQVSALRCIRLDDLRPAWQPPGVSGVAAEGPSSCAVIRWLPHSHLLFTVVRSGCAVPVQYLETIKYVEPSYVIRKFLDAQRIHNLTRYLQALHEKGRANTDHTTLLLNCFPESDTRVMTDRGFLFLGQIEAIMQSAQADSKDPLRFACYSPATEQLEYHPGKLVVKPAERRELLSFTQESEARRWTKKDGGIDGEEVPLGHDDQVSLRVTTDHDMYVQFGNRVKGQQYAWSQRGGEGGEPAPYRKEPAEGLLSECACPPEQQDCEHRRAAVRFLAAAAAGVAHDEDRSDLEAEWAQLGLRSRDQIEAFLELYGYWLGNGTVTQPQWVAYFQNKLSMSGRPSVTGEAVDTASVQGGEVANSTSAKSFGSWVLQRCSRDELRLIVQGLRRAGGAGPADQRVIFTSCPKFRDELITVLLHAGYTATFELQHQRSEQKADAWRVSYDALAEEGPSQPILQRQRDIQREEYDGRVWCVTVPTGLIVAQRACRDQTGVVTLASRPVITGNCYTKLKDVAKLDQFVKQSDVGGSSGGLAFDVLTAINVCRQANYYDHALYLARKHGEHALYLSIQIEDQNNVLDAMSYIAALPSFKEAEKYMKEYGSKLVVAFPRETTKLLINLCTGWVPTPMPFASPVDASSHALSPSANAVLSPSASGVLSPSAAPSSQRSNPAEFIHLFVEHTAELEMFLSHFFEPQHAHILQMLSNQSSAAQSGAGKDGASSSSAVAVSKDTKNPQTIVCNTLLELYLRQYAAFETAKKAKAAAEAKEGKASAAASSAGAGASSPVPSNSHHDNPYYNRAYNFIKLSYGRYDADLALVLCKMYSFEKGITHLYEKLRFYHEILQYHMEHHQAAAILATCNRHGDKVPNLWVQALAYFAAQPDPYEDAIQTVLRAIKDRKLMPPLMILQILSANPRKELGVVKDFIVASLAEENDIIAADQEEIHRFQTETATMKEEIIRLHTQSETHTGSNKALRCLRATR